MGYFDELKLNVARIRIPAVTPVIDTTLPPTEMPAMTAGLNTGIEISLDQLDPPGNFGGLLGFKGAQVILYIREHGDFLESKIESLSNRPKYHVADCRTLQLMRNQDRFGRYVVTNDVTGRFRLDGKIDGRKGSATLDLEVCKNCLTHLNYEGYRTSPAKRPTVHGGFTLSRFFVTYSTVFTKHPRGGGFSRPVESAQTAPIAAFDHDGLIACDDCGASFESGSTLISGSAAHGVQCADCRRRPPGEEAVLVDESEMRIIADARREIWAELDGHDWDDVFRLSDPAFHGLLHLYQRQGQPIPEPGVELLDSDGAVCVELGLAWSVSFDAVVLHESEKLWAVEQGWAAMTLAEALLDGQQDG